MVSPTAAGRGVGRALAQRVLEVAAEDGYAAMQFNAVVETNEPKVRLWESLGFTTLRVCASTKSAASDITTSGSPHPHQAPPRR
jgi:GNAT superfamily N-acetyltransferase